MRANDTRSGLTVAMLLTWGAGCLAYLLFVALTMRGGLPLHGDETFFATCAARGAVTDRWLMPGCHDNKGPVVYLVYRLLGQLSGDPFSAAAAKLAAAALLVAALALLGATAARAFDRKVAALGAFVCLLTIASNPQTLVLNTDLVGTLCIAAAAAILAAPAPPLAARALLAGLFVGLAMMTKQTFVVFALPASWTVWREGRAAPGGPARGLKAVLLTGGGVALPLAGFAAWFAVTGELQAFLASVFLYPLTYGQGVGGSAAREFAYRALGLVQIVDRAALLSLGCAAALAMAGRSGRGAEAPPGSAARRARRVLAGWSAAAMLLLITAPVLGVRVATPFVVCASFVAAGAFARLAVGWRDVTQRPARRAALAGFGVLAVAATLNVWGENGPRRDGDQGFVVERVPEARGKLGYVFAVWPQFHYFNAMLPASDVAYASAFDGRVRSAMEKPRHARWVQDWLARTRHDNEARLAADFARTPPAFIVVGNTVTGLPTGPVRSGVATLDAYLETRCRFVRDLAPPKLETASYTALGLYACT